MKDPKIDTWRLDTAADLIAQHARQWDLRRIWVPTYITEAGRMMIHIIISSCTKAENLFDPIKRVGRGNKAFSSMLPGNKVRKWGRMCNRERKRELVWSLIILSFLRIFLRVNFVASDLETAFVARKGETASGSYLTPAWNTKRRVSTCELRFIVVAVWPRSLFAPP